MFEFRDFDFIIGILIKKSLEIEKNEIILGHDSIFA